MRWLILTGIVIVNLAGVYCALAPDLVSYAQGAPPEVQCAACASADVQQALAHAAAVGRSQAAGMIRPQMITAVAAANIAAVACLLWGLGFRQRRVP
ncbi:MAG: hypothetical protein JSR36_02830 [Proteobacteria bacterium]|nr:hypothetical protein [Pseudomonadota bacterium]